MKKNHKLENLSMKLSKNKVLVSRIYKVEKMKPQIKVNKDVDWHYENRNISILFEKMLIIISYKGDAPQMA